MVDAAWVGGGQEVAHRVAWRVVWMQRVGGGEGEDTAWGQEGTHRVAWKELGNAPGDRILQ